MNNKPTIYHASGKLLLSGEYFVLHGATALALPLKVGQKLSVQEGADFNILHWQALYKGESWFECELSPVNFTVIKSSDPEKASTLSLVFKTIAELNPKFDPQADTSFQTTLDADPEWGFGSSSTLISLLSQWADVNAFQLNEMLFNGSGFDIACATAQGPILYTKDKAPQPAELQYSFADQLLLVYSGKKKNTFPEVSSFIQNNKVTARQIEEMSALSGHFARCTDQPTFNRLIREHEALVGQLINQQPVKERLFPDFEGEIKSMGAWGGDYYLASCARPATESKKYFENKGLNIIFNWAELIKTF